MHQCAHAPGREGEGRGKGGACICTPNDLHSRVGLDARGCLDQPARHNPWVPMHMRVHVWGAGGAVGAAARGAAAVPAAADAAAAVRLWYFNAR